MEYVEWQTYELGLNCGKVGGGDQAPSGRQESSIHKDMRRKFAPQVVPGLRVRRRESLSAAFTAALMRHGLRPLHAARGRSSQDPWTVRAPAGAPERPSGPRTVSRLTSAPIAKPACAKGDMAMTDQYEPATYGERIAKVYDDIYPSFSDSNAMVETLAKLAGAGPVLELGIGTGRVALALASHGVRVHGIDASQAMVEKLRAKPGGASIPIAIGDFADVDVAGRYSLIYVVFNTFFALASQDDQVRCFANCASHLDAGGALLIEAFYPDLTRYVRGQNVSAVDVDTDRVRLEVTLHDPVQQAVTSQHIHITGSGLSMYPVRLRYAWPSELDLMARLAGLQLRSRVGSWQGDPYVANDRHISVYTTPS